MQLLGFLVLLGMLFQKKNKAAFPTTWGEVPQLTAFGLTFT